MIYLESADWKVRRASRKSQEIGLLIASELRKNGVKKLNRTAARWITMIETNRVFKFEDLESVQITILEGSLPSIEPFLTRRKL